MIIHGVKNQTKAVQVTEYDGQIGTPTPVSLLPVQSQIEAFGNIPCNSSAQDKWYLTPYWNRNGGKLQASNALTLLVVRKLSGTSGRPKGTIGKWNACRRMLTECCAAFPLMTFA